MSCDSKFSRICRLIEDSLRLYTEPEVVSLTKEKENNLLIDLSQVLRKIQIWTHELDYDSHQANVSTTSTGEKKCSQGHNCLTRVSASMMLLLTVKSQFVKHMVGNFLVAIAEFVAVSGSEWDSFINLLFICLKLAINNMLLRSTAHSTNGDEPEHSNCDLLSFVILKTSLKNANFSTAAAIIRVLRNTLKYLKQEYDDDDHRLIQVYLGSLCSFLSNAPWDFMNDIRFSQDGGTQEGNAKNGHFKDTLFFRNVDEEESKVVFLGNFVQLLCSLVEISSAVEAKVGSEDQHHPGLDLIINLLPKLLCWCLGKQGNLVKMPTSHYFRHKLLVLMLRLSYETHLNCSTLLSWLQLLHDYFKELLWKPITELESGEDECLEGSPFLLSLSDGIHGIHSLHLQRQAILLFLRCCFSLISLTGEASKQCTCAILNSCLTFDSVLELDCCRKKGLLELYKWLQGHLPANMFVDHEMYLERCRGFALSFLQLFMHEDDVLFKVLLQLLSVPSCSEQQPHGAKWTFQGLKEDIVFHISNLFNPVNLFHLFLAELHYDHQVLLDYLISKDTGISCAEYLLRCLRTVCNSWHLFIQFSMDGKFIHKPSCKKRKIMLGGSNFQAESSSVPVNVVPPSVEEERKRDFEYSCKHYNTKRQQLKEAEDCLLALKDSVESLHRKNLFPYNPEVLLKRLTKFQELCFDQKNYDLSSSPEEL